MSDAKNNVAQTAWLQDYVAANRESGQEAKTETLSDLFYALPHVALPNKQVFLRHASLLKPHVETVLMDTIRSPDPIYAGAFECAAEIADLRAGALQSATRKAAYYFERLSKISTVYGNKRK